LISLKNFYFSGLARWWSSTNSAPAVLDHAEYSKGRASTPIGKALDLIAEEERTAPARGRRAMNDAHKHEQDARAQVVRLNSEQTKRRREKPQAVSLYDFYAYMLHHNYIFAPACDTWPAASVNARLPSVIDPNGKPMQPAAWLDQNRRVEQMTWVPGAPMLIKDRLISDGGWIEKPDATIFNLYRQPTIARIPGDVTPWLDLVQRVFPNEADHIVLWLAHRVQRPHEKINHALMLGGKPGIGKDTILEPVKRAVGPWNFAEVSPKQVLGRFNGFLRAIIVRVSEARDLGDFDRYAFNDHMKTIMLRRPTCCGSTRRTYANTISPTSAVWSSPVTIKQTASICRLMIGGTLWRGPI
jgi:hypothetical protein